MGRVLQLSFLATEPFEVSAAHDLLNVGQLAAKRGFYSPDDIKEAHAQFRANCGPASFAAIRRSPVKDVMRFFPEFPKKDWTTIGTMRKALIAAQVPHEDCKQDLPLFGLALLQLELNNKKPVHRLFSLSHTHWVGVAAGCFFDVNWGGWLPIQIWERVVIPQFRFGSKVVTGWHIRNAINVCDQKLKRTALSIAEQG